MITLKIRENINEAIEMIKNGELDNEIKDYIIDVMSTDKTLDMNKAEMLFDLALLDDYDTTILTVGGSLSANDYFSLNDAEKLLNNILALQVKCIYKDIMGTKLF